MVRKKKIKIIPPPPPASASDKVKAKYYEKYDPVDLIDAGYFEDDGIFKGNKCLVDLRPERGLVTIPIEEKVARKLYRIARRSGCSLSELASRWLARDLHTKSHAG
ncbi:MAG: hypothetical protein WC975_14410 [Phycisphaerae bacterium]